MDRTGNGELFGRSIGTVHPEALGAKVRSSNAKVGDAAPNFCGSIWMGSPVPLAKLQLVGTGFVAYVIQAEHVLQESADTNHSYLGFKAASLSCLKHPNSILLIS